MATPTTKKANYSDAEMAFMTTTYASAIKGKTVTNELNKSICANLMLKGGAMEVERTIPAIRSKLASMGTYVKGEKAAGEGRKGGKKADIVAALTNAGVKLSAPDCDGLEKATAASLNAVLDRLTSQNKKIEELEETLAY